MTRPSEPSLDPSPGSEHPSRAGEEAGPGVASVRRFRSAPLATGGLLGALVALLVLYVIRDQWLFFLRSNTPEDLGPVEEALTRGRLRHNTYVTFTARPYLEAEGRYRAQDPAPGCLTGPERTLYYTLVSEAGDRVVLRTAESLKATQQIPRRARFTGRLVRMDRLPDALRMYKRFLYRLTDCQSRPKECNRQLLLGTDLPREAFLRQLGRREARIQSSERHRIDLRPTTPLFLLFQYPDEWEYELLGLAKEQAVERVKALGVPWAYVEARKDDHLFIIKPPKSLAERLVREQRRGKGYGISQRSASYLHVFGHLARQGETLVLREVGAGFPEEYVVKPGVGGEPPTLEATTPSGLVRVPIHRFVKASYHGPRILPEDAFLLIEGLSPRRAWGAILLAALAALAALGGLFLAGLGLRRPRSGWGA